MNRFILHFCIFLAAAVSGLSRAETPAFAALIPAQDLPPDPVAAPAFEKAFGSSIKKIMLPVRRPDNIANMPAGPSDNEALQSVDTDEGLPLPPYPPGARVAAGKLSTYTLGEEDTLLDVARYYHLGFVEIRAANPDIDPWTPVPGSVITLPLFRLLPRAPQKGIVVNLAQMRMYYFRDGNKEPVTFPIGIGREGLQTPTGETTVIRKTANPVWYPTDRMREEKPYLPALIPAGPSNPLGTHAIYLNWPTFLIHGSNKPWAIGRRVSSGCMRMYPENIKSLFEMVSVGTKVTVVDQPLLAGWVGNDLYLEVNPSKNQGNAIETDGEHDIKPMDDRIKKVIIDAAGIRPGGNISGFTPDVIDWNAVKKAVDERRGYPVLISKTLPPPPEGKK